MTLEQTSSPRRSSFERPQNKTTSAATLGTQQCFFIITDNVTNKTRQQRVEIPGHAGASRVHGNFKVGGPKGPLPAPRAFGVPPSAPPHTNHIRAVSCKRWHTPQTSQRNFRHRSEHAPRQINRPSSPSTPISGHLPVVQHLRLFLKCNCHCLPIVSFPASS